MLFQFFIGIVCRGNENELRNGDNINEHEQEHDQIAEKKSESKAGDEQQHRETNTLTAVAAKIEIAFRRCQRKLFVFC